MVRFGYPVVLSFLILTAGCDRSENPFQDPDIYEFDFSMDTGGWYPFFSDYPVGEEDFYELEFGHATLPEPLDTTIRALKISGNNHSDDLLSAVVRKFSGLEPNRTYAVGFDIELASNAPSNAIGVGGSPDLALGAGGISYPPENSVDELDHYRPNFESQLQSRRSNHVFKVIGTIGVSEQIPTPFMLIQRGNLDDPIPVETNSEGEFWLMVATDSGFEATTTLYYKSIRILVE